MSRANRILLVDDLAIFRELGASFLAGCGHVELASTASEALQATERMMPDVVISDMHLPDQDGAELCRLLKAAGAEESPRVLLLARPDSRDDHASAVRAGADEVLFKPLEREQLVASVRRLTDYTTPRGLPRAEISESIEITARGSRVEGQTVNVSRGGLSVKVGAHFRRREEVSVSFSLDGNKTLVSPTAQVVWSDATQDQNERVGLRFLEIDARTASKLEHYVSDHFPRYPSVPF